MHKFCKFSKFRGEASAPLCSPLRTPMDLLLRFTQRFLFCAEGFATSLQIQRFKNWISLLFQVNSAVTWQGLFIALSAVTRQELFIALFRSVGNVAARVFNNSWVLSRRQRLRSAADWFVYDRFKDVCRFHVIEAVMVKFIVQAGLLK